MTTCSQCNAPSVAEYAGGMQLCVEHHLMFQQAGWYLLAEAAALKNYFADQIAQSTGYLIPPNYINIPQPPNMGDKLTLNHINITDSKVGVINTGIIKHVKHLDASITAFKVTGNDALANSLREFTQLLWDSELEPSVKEEVAQQLAFLAAQVQAEPGQRSVGIVKSILSGIKGAIGSIGPLVEAWAKLQSLLEQAIS